MLSLNVSKIDQLIRRIYQNSPSATFRTHGLPPKINSLPLLHPHSLNTLFVHKILAAESQTLVLRKRHTYLCISRVSNPFDLAIFQLVQNVLDSCGTRSINVWTRVGREALVSQDDELAVFYCDTPSAFLS